MLDHEEPLTICRASTAAPEPDHQRSVVMRQRDGERTTRLEGATRPRWAVVIRLPDFLRFRFAPLERCIRRPIYGALLASLHRPLRQRVPGIWRPDLVNR